MAEPVLPTDTLLDQSERDPRLSAETVAVLKGAMLLQPAVPELRAQGLSDTEIVDAMVELMDAGLFELVERGDQVRFVPTDKAWTVTDIELPTDRYKARAGCRPRPR